MITLFVSDFKYISQDIYDRETVPLQLHRLTCPSCGHSACLTVHGYYTRSVHTPNGPVSLRILRVKCSCGRTHAILLSSLVPYSRVLLADQVKIAASASPSAAVSRMEGVPAGCQRMERAKHLQNLLSPLEAAASVHGPEV